MNYFERLRYKLHADPGIDAAITQYDNTLQARVFPDNNLLSGLPEDGTPNAVDAETYDRLMQHVLGILPNIGTPPQTDIINPES